MSGLFVVLMVLAMIATLGVLIFGIVGMASGSDFHRRNSNKLMRARVVMQGVALAFFAIRCAENNANACHILQGEPAIRCIPFNNRDLAGDA